jgi:hypothetical protein
MTGVLLMDGEIGVDGADSSLFACALLAWTVNV